MDVRAARWRTLRAVVGRLSRRITSACLACLPACGARTGDLSASVVTQNVEAGTSSDATLVDAFADSPAPGNDAACGAPWVVFQINGQDGGLDSTGVIYARRADGTDGHVLSLPHPDPQTPWVSGDSRYLVYTSGNDLAIVRSRVYVRRIEDGWGPTNLIAYVDDEGNRDLFLIPSAGGTPVDLTQDLRASGFPASPTWADACTKP